MQTTCSQRTAATFLRRALCSVSSLSRFVGLLIPGTLIGETALNGRFLLPVALAGGERGPTSSRVASSTHLAALRGSCVFSAILFRLRSQVVVVDLCALQLGLNIGPLSV